MSQRAGAARPPENKDTLLAARARGIARGEHVTLPVFGEAWIELPGVDTLNEIDSAVYAEMDRLKISVSGTGILDFEHERSARVLAWAVRDPGDHAVRFGSLDQWRGKPDPETGRVLVDSDLLQACAFVYQDVRERRSPLSNPGLTDEEFERIRLAIEKKNLAALLDSGVSMLSRYLLTTADRPAISPTTSPSSGESSPE